MESVVTSDMTHCLECGTTSNIDVHHCIHGYANRKLSTKYKLIVPLCHRHHMELHNNAEMDFHYKAMAQTAFEKAYPDKNFREIFGRNYITVNEQMKMEDLK